MASETDSLSSRSDSAIPLLHVLCDIVQGRPPSQWMGDAALKADQWQALAVAAQSHGIAPLLFFRLDSAGWPDTLPASVRRTLQLSFYQALAHNTLLYRELARILAALQEIPVVVLKGAALAQTLYPHMALRPMADIDLLVPGQRVYEALHLLQNLGYRLAIPEMAQSFSLDYRHSLDLSGQHEGGVAVELHWNLVASNADWRSPRIAWFWQQTIPWALPDGPASRPAAGRLQLAPGAHLLYSAAHIALQHGLSHARLLWFYDLHLLLTRAEEHLDWDDLVARACEFRWAAALQQALQTTQDYFGTALPPAVISALAAADDPEAARMVQRLSSTMPDRVHAFWNELAGLSRAEQFRRIRATLFPALGYLRWCYALPLPGWLWPCYYVYRWFDLIRTGLRALWRHYQQK